MLGLFRRLVTACRAAPADRHGPTPPSARPCLEGLEDRCVPATDVVMNTFDSGAGSLRDTIAAAASGDTVTFAAGVTGTITLTSGHIAITKSLTVAGPGAAALAVSGNHSSRIFDLNTAGASVTISGLSLTGGNAVVGGAVRVNAADTLSLDHTVLSGNTASDFGGALDLNSGATLLLTNSTVANNTAQLSGGAIAASGGTTVTIAGTTISGNSALSNGGGIVQGSSAGATLTIRDSTIAGNTAATDGGGIVLSGTGGTALIQDSTVSGNSAQGGVVGGIDLAGAALTVQNSTIAFNTTAGAGGGVLVRDGATLTLQSAIVADNRDGSGANDLVRTAGTINADHSLFSTQPGITTDNGGNLFNTDPLLAPLANNGGPTPTHALQPGSPAIDHGNNPAGLFFDQRGLPRQSGSGVDIGAYEVQQAVVVNPTLPPPPLLPAGGVFVQGSNDYLWLEAPDWSETTGNRLLVDRYVKDFQVAADGTVYVLGENDILWQEAPNWSESTRVRNEVDDNVAAFRLGANGAVFVLGENGLLWQESAHWNQPGGSRAQIDMNIARFDVGPGNVVYALDRLGNLVREQPTSTGFTPVFVDTTVLDFRVGDNGLAYVLGTDHNLWLEAPAWQQGGRLFIDATVRSFAPDGPGFVLVVGGNFNLWREANTWRQAGGTRAQIDASTLQVFADNGRFLVLGQNLFLDLDQAGGQQAGRTVVDGTVKGVAPGNS
jgi:hypothetical protein